MTRTAHSIGPQRALVPASALGFALGLLGASCAPDPVSSLSDDHCANQDGDAWCAERYPDGSRSFCARGTCGATPGRDGCVELRPEDDECYSPCGGGLSLPDDASCLDAGTTDGSATAGTTGPTTDTDEPTTGPMPCDGDDDCPDATAPFCEPASGECVSCDGTTDPNAACASLDPSQPVCVDGSCEQCTAAAPDACGGDTPVCDDATNTCVGCTEHAQCGEAACNFYTGACLPSDAVVHVGPGQDFLTLVSAVSSFDDGTEGTIIVHEADFLEAVTVDQMRVLAFLVADGDQPTWDTPGISTAPQLTVSDATVILDGLTLSGNGATASPGVRVDGGRAWIDRSRVVDNSGGAIVAQGGAELTLRNCFLGGDVNDRDALGIVGSTATVLYTTVGSGFGTASALTCDAGSTVAVRNSIVVARSGDPEVQCGGATIEDSVAEADLGGTNTALGPMDVAWFADFAGGNFHLGLVPAALVNAGQWRQGDPPVDIDGDPRPELDGAADVPGADVP
ncbi:MAG: right-handed parallel beta-helix repeat-containing protein [Nannocystaceae bacterium]